MSARALIALAGLGSLALLGGALAFQFIGGYAPCPMCIWQRWPHLAAILIALAALALPAARRPLAMAGALAGAVASGLGVFHAGVELGWWEGPTGCVGLDPAGLSADELLARLADAPLVRCDEVAWALAGVSMAGWNAILSGVLVLLWVSAAVRGGSPTR